MVGRVVSGGAAWREAAELAAATGWPDRVGAAAGRRAAAAVGGAAADMRTAGALTVPLTLLLLSALIGEYRTGDHPVARLGSEEMLTG